MQTSRRWTQAGACLLVATVVALGTVPAPRDHASAPSLRPVALPLLKPIAMLSFRPAGAPSPASTPPEYPVAWGLGRSGQLGDGAFRNSIFPVPVSSITNVVAMAGGCYHSVAVRSDRTVWAWGNNDFGQLGNNTSTDSDTPVSVTNSNGSGQLGQVVAVAAGCQHTLALTTSGTVWAWGYNGYGQLGNFSTAQSAVPVQVKGPLGFGQLTNVVAIAAGYNHSLALRSDGTVWAWGDNAQGQLGNNSTANSSLPVQVATLSKVTAIAGGGYHSLAVTSSGAVWAWGSNQFDQLGSTLTGNSTVPQTVKGVQHATAVAAGYYHSLALESNGTVWAWGYNVNGELGNGTQVSPQITPTQTLAISNAVSIAAGTYHSLALLSNHTVWGWGYNPYGQIGVPGCLNCMAPVQVAFNPFYAIGAGPGAEHSLATANPG